MPKLGEDMENIPLAASNYGYSAVKMEHLTASEYTLATLCFDESGSVEDFRDEMHKCVQEIIRALKNPNNPRLDNTIVRTTAFQSHVREVHGFKLLEQCFEGDYADFLRPGGLTALYDACVNGLEATQNHGLQLSKKDYSVNGIFVCLTDGDDNQSTFKENNVAEALKKCISGESMESLVSILIGVNIQNPAIAKRLSDFHQAAGFTQYVELGNADAKTLARLADFVSQSISSQSQALGTGGPSKSLTF